MTNSKIGAAFALAIGTIAIISALATLFSPSAPDTQETTPAEQTPEATVTANSGGEIIITPLPEHTQTPTDVRIETRIPAKTPTNIQVQY